MTEAKTVLVVGSGGREHALAWTLARSPHVGEVLVAPGNGGTAVEPGCRNLPLASVSDVAAMVELARSAGADLVVVGPEVPLACGVVDALMAAGIPAFGPTMAAARLEASKSWAKDFMIRHGIPTAASATFSDLAEAAAYLESLDVVPVVKATGLAAGKGVFLPETFAEAHGALIAMLGPEARFGEAGKEVLIEERLAGPEVSLLAFCDGKDVAIMPAAQDHKRLLDGDRGPNTGGMGAVVPSPWVDDTLLGEVLERVFRPALAGMATEGHPYIGVLYAGLMLTDQGLSVLEFNCRFGDPEAQAILPLLESDLFEVIESCLEAKLRTKPIRWRNAASATVVLAAQGYPEEPTRGAEIRGLGEAVEAGCLVFHAGTARAGTGEVTVDGGRVLAVTAVADRLVWARAQAYHGVEQVSFAGAQYRHDIGKAALRPVPDAYAAAGVDIEAANQAVAGFKSAVQRTFTDRVLTDVGAFGGLFSIENLPGRPVLCASTDGVGTKVKLAAEWGRWRGVGHDLVNHCVNDILVQGARPLFFLDYVASARLDPVAVAEIVIGIAEACQNVGAALLGGETAEMPGVYAPGAVDVAGTIVGLVDRSELLPLPDQMVVGDLLVGLASSGLHTNGYSLARKLVEGRCDEALADTLLVPHRCYLREVTAWQSAGVPLKGLAHLTGGGWTDNIPRVLPERLAARVRLGSWNMPEIFSQLVDWGRLTTEEAYRTFNMGIGLIAVLPPEGLTAAQASVPETVVVGELVARGAGETAQVVLA